LPEPRQILVVKPSSLGDVVHTLPAVALVKHRWPDARLSWVVNPEWAPLLEGNPYDDEGVIFPRQQFRGLRGAFRVPGWARELGRRNPVNLALDFQGLLRSALIARCCRKSGGRIIGLSDGREGSKFFYDEIVDVRGKAHAVDRYLAMVESLGIPVDHGTLEWPLPQGPRPASDLPERFVLLHPFSRGEGKSLTREQVTEFCLAMSSFPVVLAGRSDESIPPAENVINLLNRTTLAELIWLIRNAAHVVSVDSGPMHIAAALTSRLVSIHTWSDPLKVGPYNDGASVLKDGEIRTMRAVRAEGPGDRVAGMRGLGEWVSKHIR
jgi:ADP-heptose:LPS heptosyltransferase